MSDKNETDKWQNFHDINSKIIEIKYTNLKKIIAFLILI